MGLKAKVAHVTWRSHGRGQRRDINAEVNSRWGLTDPKHLKAGDLKQMFYDSNQSSDLISPLKSHHSSGLLIFGDLKSNKYVR